MAWGYWVSSDLGPDGVCLAEGTLFIRTKGSSTGGGKLLEIWLHDLCTS